MVTNAATQLPQTMPELGRLKAVAQRLNVASTQVEDFLDRFHGPRPEGASNAVEVPDTHRNNLDAVFTQLERIENAVGALSSIG